MSTPLPEATMQLINSRLHEYPTHPNIRQLASELGIWPETLKQYAYKAGLHRDPEINKRIRYEKKQKYRAERIPIIIAEYPTCASITELARKIGCGFDFVNKIAKELKLKREMVVKNDKPLVVNHNPERRFVPRNESWRREEYWPAFIDSNYYAYQLFR